jgi:hypothetical protein
MQLCGDRTRGGPRIPLLPPGDSGTEVELERRLVPVLEKLKPGGFLDADISPPVHEVKVVWMEKKNGNANSVSVSQTAKKTPNSCEVLLLECTTVQDAEKCK